MDGNKSLIQAKIRDAIDKGVLTRDSIERGLQALIDEEIAQNERPANQNLINACLDLFDDLHEESECAHRDASTLSRMAAHATAHTRWNRLAQNARRVAAVTVIILMGGFGASLLAGRQGLIARPTQDEQQYQIQGYVTKAGTVAISQSDEKEMNFTTETASFEEAIQELDFSPKLPTWMPDGWAADHFMISISPLSEQVHIEFCSAAEDAYIQYDILKYYNAENAITNYEQSQNGIAYLWNGKNVYISTNLNNCLAIWLDGEIQYSVSGPMDQEYLKRIIESIKGELVI